MVLLALGLLMPAGTAHLRAVRQVTLPEAVAAHDPQRLVAPALGENRPGFQRRCQPHRLDPDEDPRGLPAPNLQGPGQALDAGAPPLVLAVVEMLQGILEQDPLPLARQAAPAPQVAAPGPQEQGGEGGEGGDRACVEDHFE